MKTERQKRGKIENEREWDEDKETKKKKSIGKKRWEIKDREWTEWEREEDLFVKKVDKEDTCSREWKKIQQPQTRESATQFTWKHTLELIIFHGGKIWLEPKLLSRFTKIWVGWDSKQWDLSTSMRQVNGGIHCTKSYWTCSFKERGKNYN